MSDQIEHHESLVQAVINLTNSVTNSRRQLLRLHLQSVEIHSAEKKAREEHEANLEALAAAERNLDYFYLNNGDNQE